jgi:ABC-type Fe3+-hydroxamate transport system substrate-binding protein
VLELALDRQRDFDRDAILVGRAVGHDAQADSLVAAVRRDLESASQPAPVQPTVFVLAWNDPPIAIGGGSFLSEIISRAGARNVFADAPQPSFVVSIEAVVGTHPDLILAVGPNDPEFIRRPEWQAVDAVRARRLVRVDGSMFNRPSPRIGQAVRALRAALAAARP